MEQQLRNAGSNSNRTVRRPFTHFRDATTEIVTAAPAKTYVDAGTQTSWMDVLRTGTLVNVQALFKGIDNQIPIGEAQDQEWANELEKLSEIPSPAGTQASDCVCLPPDVMAYEIKDQHGQTRLAYNCPEINGTGFGGIRDLPPQQLQTIKDTYHSAAREIREDCLNSGETPLMIVANSGREGAKRRPDGTYEAFVNSKMIWEKAHVADTCAEALGTFSSPVFGDSLDKITTPYLQAIDAAKARFDSGQTTETEYRGELQQAHTDAVNRMKQHDGNPLVLLGYSRDVAECCNIQDGRPYLFGRPVHGLVNDRAAMNLQNKEGQTLDFKKVRLINCTVEEGVDKFAAARARDEFHKSPEAKLLAELAKQRGFTYDVAGLDKSFHFPRGASENIEGMDEVRLQNHRLTYFRGVTAEEGLEGIRAALEEFQRIGLKPLYKPNGSGQSKGIIGYRTGESVDDFMRRFEENIEAIERDFGKGAGYPFLVMPLLKLAETPSNEAYDLRWTIYQKIDQEGKQTLHSIPLILKKEPPKDAPTSGDTEFSPTNVTAAVAKTGRPGTDFIIPLCSKEGIQQAGLTEDQVRSMSLYFSAFQSWLLKTHYSRELSAS